MPTTAVPTVEEATASLANARAAASAAENARAAEAIEASERRFLEERGRATACRSCGRPHQQVRHVGVTQEEKMKGARFGVVDYFCPDCTAVMVADMAARAAVVVVDGRTIAQHVGAYLDTLA
jgi:hypothetical protein